MADDTDTKAALPFPDKKLDPPAPAAKPEVVEQPETVPATDMLASVHAKVQHALDRVAATEEASDAVEEAK